MKSDKYRTKEQLMNELVLVRQRIREFEAAATESQKVEAKYAKLVESGNDGIIIVQDGWLVFANAKMTAMTGFPMEDAIGKSFLGFVAPDCRALVADTYRKRVAGVAVPDRYEAELLTRTGAKIPIEINASLIEYEGRPAVMAIVRDMTERKLAEKALGESEAKYRALVENAADIIFMTDKDGRILSINAAGARFLRKDRAEITGKTVFDFFPEEPARNFSQKLQMVLETGVSYSGEVNLMAGETATWLSTGLSPIRNPANEVVAVMGVSRDITLRKRIEKRIAQLDSVLRSVRSVNQLIVREKDKKRLIQKSCNLLVESPCYSFTWILLVDDNGEFVSAAAAGIPEETFSGITGQFRRGEYLQCAREILAAGPPFGYCDDVAKYHGDCPLARHHAGGAGFTCRLEHEGRVYGVMSGDIARDAVTDPEEQKLFSELAGDISFALSSIESNEKRKQAENEAEQTIKELETFAYTAAHDLKAPLVTVQGFAGMLRADLAREEKDRVEEDLSLIEAGIAKMQRLLKSTLEYGRAGRMVKPTENVPFGEIVRESLQQVAGQIQLSGASISLAETFPTVYVDRTVTVQVLNNLIQNSTEYRDRTRPLAIEIGHRLLDGEVVYFVRDIGISPDQMGRVFEPFYRGAKESQGTGLGLKIAKKIIEGYGGRVWIESEAGKGTTVCFTLAGRKGQ